MKIILLLLSITILFGLLKNMPSVFCSKEKGIKQIKSSISEFKSDTSVNEKDFKNLVSTVTLFVTGFYIVYYTMCAFYVGTFLLSLLSVLFIIRCIRRHGHIIKTIDGDNSYVSGFIGKLFSKLADVSYVLIILINLYVNWNK